MKTEQKAMRKLKEQERESQLFEMKKKKEMDLEYMEYKSNMRSQKALETLD